MPFHGGTMDGAVIDRNGVTSRHRRRVIIAALSVSGFAVLLAARLLSLDEVSGSKSKPGTTPAAVAPSEGIRVADIKARRLFELPGPADEPVAAGNHSAWDCNLESLPVFAAFHKKADTPQLAGYAARLAESVHVEHVLAAAILSDNFANGSVDTLTERAIALDPGHPVVLWWAAGLCTRFAKPVACRDPGLQQRILAANRDNGAYWAMVANQQLRNGSDGQAVISLQRAATAAMMDQHIVQQTLLLERGLSAIGDLGSAERAILAVWTAPLSGDLGELFDACGERPAADAVWAQACLDWGRRLASESTSAMHKFFGYVVQTNVLEQVDPSAELTSINAAQQALRDEMNAISEDWMLLMLVDHRFSAQFVDQFAANGEIAALRYAEREILRLQADPNYDPCALAEAAGGSGDSAQESMLRVP